MTEPAIRACLPAPTADDDIVVIDMGERAREMLAEHSEADLRRIYHMDDAGLAELKEEAKLPPIDKEKVLAEFLEAAKNQ